MGLVSELRRRNVFRVAIAYVIIAWLILQVGDTLAPALRLADWVNTALAFFLIVGFPLAIFFAWAYELTPEGIKLEQHVDRSQSITHLTGRKLDYVIIAVLSVALVYFAFDKFVLDVSRDAELVQTTTEAVTEQAIEPAKLGIPAKSVAVLPFVAISNGPDDEYFADGLTEEILNSLSHVPELLVTARTSAFAFKGQNVPVPEIAARLGVAHVVEGSVRRDGEQVRITAQLVRAANGFHVWSDSYDRSSQDSFGVQAEIAEKVAAALDVVLDEEQLQRMRSVDLSNPEAFIAFQKGVELYDLWHGSGRVDLEPLVKANVWFDKTLALSPGLSTAYAYHTDPYVHLLIDAGNGQAIPEEELTVAIEQIEKDYGNAMSHALDEPQRLSASFNLALITGKWRGLTTMSDEITKQKSCRANAWLAVSTLAYGKAREYLTLQQTLISCDPLNYSGWFNASRAYMWLGEHEAAIEIIRKGLEATSHGLLRRFLVLAHIAAGQLDQAEIIIDRDIRNERSAIGLRERVTAANGDAAKTKTLINEYIAAGFEESYWLIVMRAIAGERELANKLAAEFDARPYGYMALMLVPHSCMCGAPFDLEATPNFAKLIEDANLPWPPASPIEWPLKDW
jgi:TolB-like protein/tetratricopeptide (TPR) repeat protein